MGQSLLYLSRQLYGIILLQVRQKFFLCFVLWGIFSCKVTAKEPTKGELLLAKCDSAWKELCIHMSLPPDSNSHSFNEITTTLEQAVQCLKKEHQTEKYYEGILLLAELYDNLYETQEKGQVLLQQVAKKYSRESIKGIRARGMLASLICWNKPISAAKIIEGISDDDVLGMEYAKDIIIYYRNIASVLYYNGDHINASLCYNRIRKMNIDAMDEYTLVHYIMAMCSYMYYLMGRGEIKESAILYEKCMEIMDNKGLKSSIAYFRTIEMNGLCYYHLGEYDEALRRFDLVGKAYHSFFGTKQSLLYIYNLFDKAESMSFFYGYSSQLKALKELDVLRQFLSNCPVVNHAVLHRFYGTVGFVTFKAKDYETSSYCYKKCLDIGESMNLMWGRDYANYVNILWLAGKDSLVIQYAREGVEKERDYLKHVFSAMSDRGREQYWINQGYIDNLLLTNAVANNKDSVGVLYDLSLLSKTVLMDSSSQFSKYISSKKDARLRNIWEKYNSLQVSLIEQLEVSIDNNKSQKLLDEMLKTEIEMMSYASEFKNHLVFMNTTWEDISQSLSEDSVAIEFVSYAKQSGKGEKQYIASIICPQGKPINIPLPQVDDAAFSHLSQNRLFNTSLLYDSIIKPLENYLKGKINIYYSPSGCLNSISFDAILTPSGARLNECFDLHRVSSTSVLLQEKKNPRCSSAFLIGGCDYNLGVDEMKYYANGGHDRGKDFDMHNWNYLPGSLEEVHSVAEILKSRNVQVFTGEEALEDKMKQISGNSPEIIHVATHGYYDASIRNSSPINIPDEDRAMLSSGLVFSGANNLLFEEDNLNNGFLSAKEISNLNLYGCELVVLSSCGSGLGVSDSYYNEYYGLVRALKKAGAQSIVVSLWDIDDNISVLFMKNFYNNILMGNSIYQAMKKSRNSVRDKYPEPRYWASFVLID